MAAHVPHCTAVKRWDPLLLISAMAITVITQIKQNFHPSTK